MNVIQIIQQANSIADEEISNNIVIGFVNDAIARINVKCNAKFPFCSINDVNSDYPGFPETWQRALLVPFAVGRIKQTDSSQFEYSDSYGEFQDNLITFQNKYPIPDVFKDTTIRTSYEPDFSASLWRW